MSITWSSRKSTKRKKWKLIGGHSGTKYAGRGKHYKSSFHKAERRAIKNQLYGYHIRRSYNVFRSNLNWKGW